MVLYSWIVPCFKQSCPSKFTSGCTSHIKGELKKYVQKTKVIVAYTTLGTLTSGTITCDATKTEKELKDAHIDVIRITDNFEEDVAMIENLIKLGKLMQILE